jgi:DNA repair exonuclease SbcCD nuclease subunit
MEYDYVALGHIHKPAVLRVGSTPAVYPGCIEGKGFDDPGVPRWTVVEFDTRRAASSTPTLREVPVDIQPIRTLPVDLTQIDSPDELRERIAPHRDPEAIQRIALVGSLHFGDFDPGALQAELGPYFFHLEVRDETTAVAPDLIARWAQEPTVRGAFVQRMQERLSAADSEEEREALGRALRFGVQALRVGNT